MNKTPIDPHFLGVQDITDITPRETQKTPEEAPEEQDFEQSLDLQFAIGKRLTPKQELFALYVAQGLSNFEAYKKAYDRQNDKPSSISSNAWKTSKVPGVPEAIEFFRKQIITQSAASFQYDVQQAFNETQEIANWAREKKDGRLMLECIKMRASLNGLLVKRTADVSEKLSLDIINQDLEAFIEKQFGEEGFKKLKSMKPAPIVNKNVGPHVIDMEPSDKPKEQ